MFVFLDLLERVAERFQPEQLTFKHHVLIIKYIGKKERKKVLLSSLDKVELAYKWSGKRTVLYT